MDAPDVRWQALLEMSRPTFNPEPEPPFGFVTSVLVRLKAEERQQREAERIGWRALVASFAALAIAATVVVGLDWTNSSPDFDPGVRGLVQADNVPIS